ncbi:MAG: glycosyltransferase family 39 protein [Bacteroidetes bacterium]|nr:glycosyltransferase family 39 protein [Bacteroidota bacterium]
MKSFSRLVFWGCAAALFVVTMAFPRYERPGTEATLAWDVSGYYLYLPAVFIYHDLKQVKFLPGIIQKYKPSFAPDQAFPVENGNQVMKYSAGMAVMYLPFFAVGHAVAKLTGHPADGFSLPYQAAIHLGGVLVAVLGLWFLRKNLLRYFPDRTVGWTLLLVALGTNFFNYATFDAANAHVWLFALLAMLVHCTIRWHERPTLRGALSIGACVGLAALVRPTEIICALVPLLWGITDLKSLRKRLSFFKKNFTSLLVAGITVAAIGSLQLGYWKYVSGHWLVYSYGEQGFSFLHPHFVNVFFSYRKGWLVYTPLMALALLGFGIADFGFRISGWPGSQSEIRNPKSAIVAFFLVNTWVVCAWDIWWYGGAFGQRAMVQSYALLAFPLAAFLAKISEIRNPQSAIVKLLLFGCLALNLFQTYQAHWGPWEAEAMNRAYYWRIFGRVKDVQTDKLLLDAKEGFSGEKKNVRVVYTTDFETVTDSVGVSARFAKSGTKSAFVDPQTPFSHTLDIPRPAEMPRGKWLHISAQFYGQEKTWEAWVMPQLVVRFEQQGQPVRERAIRPWRVIGEGEWGEAGMDIRVPKKEFDHLKIFLWNPSNRPGMWMDDLRVETFEE